MKNLWFEITVEIRDRQYSYSATKGEGNIEFTFPEELFEGIDFGKLIDVLKASAYADYKNNLESKPIEDEEK